MQPSLSFVLSVVVKPLSHIYAAGNHGWTRMNMDCKAEKQSFVWGLSAHLLGALLSGVKESIPSVFIGVHLWLKVFRIACLRLRVRGSPFPG